MGYIDELERQAVIDREGPNPVYPTQQVGVTIPANTTLENYIDATFATDADKTATNAKLNALSPFASITGSCANDTAAASANVPVGGLYHTAGAIKVRLT
jgi:hypothetical protein